MPKPHLGTNPETSDAEALRLFNLVRQRGITNAPDETSLTFEKIFNERRLELACEGDNWYDFVGYIIIILHWQNNGLTGRKEGHYNNLKEYL